MCRCFFLQNNLIGPKVCENLEFLQKWGEQERPIPYFLYPHRDYDSSRESIQLQKVLAFCDFWFQRVITSHSAYVATETELYGAKIDGFLYPNFM